MQIIAHNLASMFTNRQLNITTKNKSKAVEKLSSGYRVNRAADDAAGLSISEKMRYQIRGLDRGSKNTEEGISFIQVADGAMQEIHSMIQRIRELSVQASNDTNTTSDKQCINEEIKHIRNEINRVCADTEFNNQPVFENSAVSIEIGRRPEDLQIFDATYDDGTGQVTYGGFIFHGERLTWDMIDPDMVKTDTITGEQIFLGGDYTYTDQDTGYTFQISCNVGDTVPKISRTINISADNKGVIVDGKHFSWYHLSDKDGKLLSDHTIHAGIWNLNYQGTNIEFQVGASANTVSDMAKAINSMDYVCEIIYSGVTEEKAVDADVIKNLRVSNNLLNILGGSDKLDIRVRAGKDAVNQQDGIWLEKSDGTVIAGSYRTWASMGITSWNSGKDINSSYSYIYHDDDGSNDTYFSFEYNLSDVTSVDSVIDGLDNMVICSDGVTTKYGINTSVTIPKDGNLISATHNHNGENISFQEEKVLGRDFDKKQINGVASTDLVYDSKSSNVKAIFADANGNPVITYNGSTTQIEKELYTDLTSYISYVLSRKKALALNGKDPQKEDLTKGDLSQIVGAGNITSSGYFDQVITIDSTSMKLTNGAPGVDGVKYPGAYIDFSDFGNTYTADTLIGLGFNSTCKTCSNHYSIVFVEDASLSTTPQGYKYNYKSQNNDYALQIDINSINAKNGEELASALIDIVSECFDFHFTQYAAEGSKLYIYDNRPSNSGTMDATFETKPHLDIYKDVFSVSLNTNDGKTLNFNYTYDYEDIKDDVIVEMVQDNNGDYIQRGDGSYEKYDSSDASMVGSQRYNLNVSYKKHSDSSVAVGIDELIRDCTEGALTEMIQNSHVRLDAKDYTYMQISGDESPNVAIKAVFTPNIAEKYLDKGLIIQNSSNSRDIVKIPRFSVNTSLLKLDDIDVESYEAAQNTIRCSDYAINYISSKRSLYGAYQNRLEYIYNNSRNTLENTQAAESRIRDADMAREMVSYSKSILLEQVTQTMLSQANQQKDSVRQLLQE